MASATATANPDSRARARREGPGDAARRGGWPLGSRLGRLIVVLNLLGLAILIGGALVLNEMRAGAGRRRLESLTLRAKSSPT